MEVTGERPAREESGLVSSGAKTCKEGGMWRSGSFNHQWPDRSVGALKTEYGCQTNFLEMKSLRRRFNDMYKKRFRELDEAASHGKDEPRVQVLERYGEELDEQNNVLLSILEQTQQKMVETKEERDSKIQCLESQIETLEKQLHDTASKMDGKDGMIYDLKNEIADLKFHHMVKSGEAQRQEERIKSLQEELNKSHINAEKEMDTLRSNITNLKYRLEESNRQGAQWREEKSALETKLMEKEEIIKKCNEEYGKLEAKYQEKELEVQKQGKTIKRLQQEIEKGHQELNAANKKANKEIIAKRDDNIKKLEKEIKQLKVKNQIKKKQFQKQGETIRKLQAEVDKSHQKQDSVNRNSDNAVGVKETPESYATIKDEVSQLRYDIASCLEEYDKAHRGADEEIANKDDTIQKRTEGRGMKAMCPENVVILRQREAITMLQQEVSKSHQELDTANKNADKELDKLRDVIMSLEQDQEENNKKEEEMKEEINFLEEQRAASDAIVLKLNKEIDKLRAEEEFNKVQKEECISKLKQENSRIQKEVEKARKIANEEWI
ncbi:coiled-coil domain-containing protein 186-like [Saccostrea echinata]|uniref:coiled-coil domain-containing protein 186-like n=1 Tax=Saccostrea echinata TaxID=191078 RepID=UPI002A83F0EA|nr:coiled-coil domain-containing protein 186-like [Saccostrea echinata]